MQKQTWQPEQNWQNRKWNKMRMFINKEKTWTAEELRKAGDSSFSYAFLMSQELVEAGLAQVVRVRMKDGKEVYTWGIAKPLSPQSVWNLYHVSGRNNRFSQLSKDHPYIPNGRPRGGARKRKNFNIEGQKLSSETQLSLDLDVKTTKKRGRRPVPRQHSEEQIALYKTIISGLKTVVAAFEDLANLKVK